MLITCGNRSLLPTSRRCQLPRARGPRDPRGCYVAQSAERDRAGKREAREREYDIGGGEATHATGTSQRDDQRTTAQQRRKELLEAADRVVLRDGPEASMNAIAAEAGITKPILYRHFGDKGGLYRALAKRHTDALLASLRAALDAPAEDRRHRVEATLDTYLAAIEARPRCTAS